MNEELLKILQMLKEDFEMLQDGSWDLNYSDGTEIEASLENVEKAIKIVKTNKVI
jgi:cell division septal protein FtsQ